MRMTRRCSTRSTDFRQTGDNNETHAHLSLWTRFLRLLSRDLALRDRFCDRHRGAEDDRWRRGRAGAGSARRQSRAAHAFRRAAQRDGAAGVQALVDDDHSGLRRAADLCAACDRGARVADLAMASVAGHRLAGQQSAGCERPARPVAVRMADRRAVDFHDQSLRAVRALSGRDESSRQDDSTRTFQDARTSTSWCAIRSISASSSRSGRRR